MKITRDYGRLFIGNSTVVAFSSKMAAMTLQKVKIENLRRLEKERANLAYLISW